MIDRDVFFSILGHLSELVPYFSEGFFSLLNVALGSSHC